MTDLNTKTQLLTPAELEASYRIAKATLAKWRWNGSGPTYVKLGAKVLYRRSDVEAWIASRERTATPANEG
jgi:predicted DNA-binding transcriptional regulator AlpA